MFKNIYWPAGGRTWIGPLACMLVALLAACSSTEGKQPARTRAATAQAPMPSATPTEVLDAAFLAAVRPEIADRSDGDLISMGLATCGVLHTGASWLQVVSTVVGDGLQARAAGALVAASVAAYCPEYKSLLPS